MVARIAFNVTGDGALEAAFARAGALFPQVIGSIVTEGALFGERETKIGTPVRYGLLRASIGHAEPPASAADGIWEERRGDAGGVWTITFGTNVEYAPYIEHGFTMTTGRVVYIEGVGYRYVHPFSYRGAHMFARAAAKLEQALPTIANRQVDELLVRAGLA